MRNKGVAFGLFAQGSPWIQSYFFIPISIAASLVMLFIIFRAGSNEMLKVSALSMVLAGALGNLLDRWRWGEVVDFIDIHYRSLHWPAFNVADASISVGVILLGIVLVLDG